MSDPEKTIPLLAATGGLRLGGSTTFLVNLGGAFHKLGLELPILCIGDINEMETDFLSAQVEVVRISQQRMIYEDRIKLAYAEIFSRKPRAVLACLGSPSFEVLRLLPKNVFRLGIIQSDDPAPYELVRAYADHIDAIIGVSETICEKLRHDPVLTNSRIEHIPYGISFADSPPRPARDSSAPLRIVYAGRMIEIQKQVNRLWKLAETLAARRLKFEFTFVGSGPELKTGQERLKQFSNVRFLGDVPNHAMAGILRSQDVFVLLSDFEGLPLSLLEAMGESVVPVVSDVESGMRGVVSEERGLRVPIGDVSATADAIVELSGNPEKLARLGRNCRSFALENYSSAKMAERYLKLIEATATSGAVWQSNVPIPPPRLVNHPWLYQGFPRLVRRFLKPFSS